jgi:hypothetical protein
MLSAIGMYRKNPHPVLAALRLLLHASSCWRQAPIPQPASIAKVN